MKARIVLLRQKEGDEGRGQRARFQILETPVTEGDLVNHISPEKRLHSEEAFAIMETTVPNDQCMITVDHQGQIVHGVWENGIFLKETHSPGDLLLSPGFWILSKI